MLLKVTVAPLSTETAVIAVADVDDVTRISTMNDITCVPIKNDWFDIMYYDIIQESDIIGDILSRFNIFAV